jgi:DEAD/DEAH box helicase domain-containing protein
MLRAMSKNLVYFDLETQKSAQEVGGWDRIADMRLSIGVTYSTARGTYEIYDERTVDQLIQELQRADLVIGYNIFRFDYILLQAYSIFDFSQVPSLDLMVDVEKSCGQRLPLDAIAEATLGVNKTAEGMAALKWWKEGRIREIAEYCCYDVKATKWVHEFGVREGRVRYKDRKTQLIRDVSVAWT